MENAMQCRTKPCVMLDWTEKQLSNSIAEHQETLKIAQCPECFVIEGLSLSLIQPEYCIFHFCGIKYNKKVEKLRPIALFQVNNKKMGLKFQDYFPFM